MHVTAEEGEGCTLKNVVSWGLPAVLVVALFATACGGPKEPVTPTPIGGDAGAGDDASADAGAGDAEAAPSNTVSVVRYDDLGVSYAIPNGYKVLGDDDLASRVRASANPRLQAALEKRASQRKGIPLLSLAKETTERGDGLSITVSVTIVPKDATAAEVLTQQKATMGENLESFSIVEDESEKTIDGVKGTQMGVKYILRAGGEARRMASFLRIFVREGVAYLVVTAFPETSGRAEEARLVLDGLHFYAPAP